MAPVKEKNINILIIRIIAIGLIVLGTVNWYEYRNDQADGCGNAEDFHVHIQDV